MTLDLSTDLPLPKSLGGDAAPPIKEHRIDLREVAKEWGNEADEAKNALVKIINGAAPIAPNAEPASRLHPDSKKPFDAFTEQFMEQKRLGKKERTNRRTAFNNLRHIVGDKPIHKIGVNEIIGFRDFVAKQRGRHGRADANYKTVNKKLSFLRVFFDWAKEERNLISQNPVTISAKPSRAEREAEEENRRPFTAKELEHIFHSPLFVGCKSLRRIHDSGTVRCRNEKFWFPIIGLYTGCRLDEIQQLEVTDIIQHEGRWCFDISRESQFGRKKTTKNKASIRRVPLHADLTKMGFMDYWKIRQGNAKDGLLFPKYGYGKMFNETLLLTWLGIKEPDISFHSLRHNFKDVAANATQSDFVVSRLMGHSQSDMTGRYGTRQHLTAEQMAVIDRMRFPISMKHLFAV